jgi:hypothetical protein
MKGARHLRNCGWAAAAAAAEAAAAAAAEPPEAASAVEAAEAAAEVAEAAAAARMTSTRALVGAARGTVGHVSTALDAAQRAAEDEGEEQPR